MGDTSPSLTALHHITVAVVRRQYLVTGRDSLILKKQVVAVIVSTVHSLESPVPPL